MAEDIETLEELEPCPFCGYNNAGLCATDYTPEKRRAYAISCRTRECHGVIFSLGFGLFDSREKAVAAWNMRCYEDKDSSL